MARTISQRLALTGGDEIKRMLLALGQEGEKAFGDIQAAAEKLRGPGAAFARSMDAARKRVAEFGKEFDRIGAKIRNFGAGVSVAITAPVTLLGRSFIQAASDAEEARSAFGFLFKSATDDVRGWANTVAADLGRGSQDIQDQVSAFQQLFGQVTRTQPEAVKLSKQFTVLAQDLASFYNVAEDDALAKLRSGLAGESEPLRAFGVFINEAAVKAKALDLGLRGVNGELTDQEKVLARAAIILEKTTAAQGDAARTSGSYANQLKRLQGVWQDLSISLGEVILPTALQVVQGLSSLIATIQQLPVSTQTTIVVFAALAATLGPILAGIGLMVQGIAGLATGFAFIMGVAAKFTGALAALAGGWNAVVFAMRAVLALVAGMLSWPVVLGAAFGLLAVAVATHWDEIVATVADALTAVEEAAQSAMDSVKDWFGSAFDWIADKAASVLDWMMERLKAIKEFAQSVFSGSGGGASGAAPGYAGGGRVRGRGTSTSDSILARLSTGEFVIRASAVQHYGAQLFERLNRMSMPRTLVPGFASGGLVSTPADAGGSGGYATLNLTIGSEVFRGLTAPRETAERLIRFATAEETKKAGRRPAWFEGG